MEGFSLVPALARAVGVMLKNAWLQALLMRPARMKEKPGGYFRPAVFICDEYQAFASVGEDDPSGDEKSFALTRQCRYIPQPSNSPKRFSRPTTVSLKRTARRSSSLL